MRIKYKSETGTLLSQSAGTCQLLMDSGEVVFTNMQNVFRLDYEEDVNGRACDLICPKEED